MSLFTPVFRPALYNPYSISDLAFTKLSSLFRLEQQQKTVLKIHFEFAYFSFFLSFSFGIETRNTFVHSRSTLGYHTRFHTEMIKVYVCFQTKTAQKPYTLGRHIPIWLTYGITPPPANKLFMQFWPFCPTGNRRSNFYHGIYLCVQYFF